MSSSIPSQLGRHRVFCLLLLVLVLFNVAVLVLLRGTWHSSSSSLLSISFGLRRPSDPQLSNVRSTPVYQLLSAATLKAAARGTPTPDPAGLHAALAQPGCQLQQEQLAGVLATVAAFTGSDSMQGLQQAEARGVALAVRDQLKQKWAAALMPFAQPLHTPHQQQQQQHRARGVSNSSSSRRCQSVGLVPQPADSHRPSTALLLVLGDWAQLDRMLRLYCINLFTIWAYAQLHGYGLHLYVHGHLPLPHGMPVYFIKVLGVRHLFEDLGYQRALYLDFDTFTSPHTAPPLSLLYGEAPAASLLLQGEHNVCAAAMLWRNTPEAAALLQAWWDVGAAGCCPTFPHDQIALKHMVLAYLANVTGQPGLYGADMRERFKLPPAAAAAVGPAGADAFGSSSGSSWPGSNSTAAQAAGLAAGAAGAQQQQQQASDEEQEVLSTDLWPHSVSTMLQLRPLLQQTRSAVGFVGLDAHFPSTSSSSSGVSGSRVVLHNCMGMWWGCVPFSTPALLYHTGHWAMDKLSSKTAPWLAERLLHSIRDWSVALDLQQQQHAGA